MLQVLRRQAGRQVQAWRVVKSSVRLVFKTLASGGTRPAAAYDTRSIRGVSPGRVCGQTLADQPFGGIQRPMSEADPPRPEPLWQRLLSVAPEERRQLVGAAGGFFCLMCAYAMLRPLREEMAIAGGVDEMQWLFTATFAVMLLVVPVYSWAVARTRRSMFIPWTYRCLGLVLVGFFVAFSTMTGTSMAWGARVFFVFMSVFNLLVISVFWELMADHYTREQGGRLFGLIAAGGSLGAVVGPLLTSELVGVVGPGPLLLAGAALLEVVVWCLRSFLHMQRDREPDGGRPIGGSALAAVTLVARSPMLLGICGYLFLHTFTSTFLYFEQAHLVKAELSDAVARTQFFARIDFAVNTLALLVQVFAFGRLIKRLGILGGLVAVPVLSLFGLAALAMWPTLVVLAVVQVVRRGLNYAVAKPAREVLFTLVTREEAYKAKSLIDTAVYRGGDAMSGWAFAGLRSLQLSLGAVAWVAVPVCGVWIWLAARLGKHADA